MAKQTTPTAQGKAANSSVAARPKPVSSGTRGDTAARRLATPSLLTFFQESRAELRKVTWPTRQETINLTIAVIVMTVGIAAFLGIIDQILNWIISPLIK